MKKSLLKIMNSISINAQNILLSAAIVVLQCRKLIICKLILKYQTIVSPRKEVSNAFKIK